MLLPQRKMAIAKSAHGAAGRGQPPASVASAGCCWRSRYEAGAGQSYDAAPADGVRASCQSACGSGLPLVSGRNGAATTPRMKNSPTIVAAGPKPPK